MREPKARQISYQKAHAIINSFMAKRALRDTSDYGRFYVKYANGTVLAIDNSHGDCWVEEFKSRTSARRWLLQYA